MRSVFVSGGTGFVGQGLIRKLRERGHDVAAVARAASASKLPEGVRVVPGNPLDASTFEAQVMPADTYVHLVGVAKPAPWKGAQFRAVDLVSLQQSVAAAKRAAIRHFVYVSVAHPAPVMRAYIEVRQECEALIAATGITATIIRPWYVLGPGRKWPLLLVPFYKLFESLGVEGARRLGLVTLDQMIGTLVWSVENPGARVLEVPEIRRIGSPEIVVSNDLSAGEVIEMKGRRKTRRLGSKHQ